MKKQYTKMTVECDAFELNEAIAACATYNFSLAYSGPCDDCKHTGNLNHSWDVYVDSNSGKYFAVSINDAPGNEFFHSSCYRPGIDHGSGSTSPIKAGDAIWASSPSTIWNDAEKLVDVMRNDQTPAGSYDGDLSAYIRDNGIFGGVVTVPVVS